MTILQRHHRGEDYIFTMDQKLSSWQKKWDEEQAIDSTYGYTLACPKTHQWSQYLLTMILHYEANRDYQNNRQLQIIMVSQKDKENSSWI